MNIADIERCLEKEQREVSDHALENPGDKTEYGYGYACGYFMGLGAAWQAIEKMYRDEEDNDAKI